MQFKQRTVWSLQEAREALERLIGQAGDWSRLDEYLMAYLVEPSMRATVFASSLAATLELVREGEIEVHQQAAFAPIYLRKREAAGHAAAVSSTARRARSNELVRRAEAWRPWRNDASYPTTNSRRGPSARRRRGRSARPEHLRLLEALLFAASAPLDEKTLGGAAAGGRRSARPACARCRPNMRRAASTSCSIGSKWTFRTATDLSWLLTKEAVVPKKLSRAAIETLAVIAYHQPVTRAEVEEIRGVVMSKGTFDVLMETGWIRPRGRRKTPGRPITYGTTEEFLSHFGLEALADLPGLEELKGSGLLDGRLPPGFAVPMPSDDPALRDDEDPLEPGDLDLGLAPPPERIEERVAVRHSAESANPSAPSSDGLSTSRV